MMLDMILRLPGFGGAPAAPALPPPPPPVPTREDPAVDEARNRLRQSEKRRRGRRSTRLAGTIRGIEANPLGVVSRPEARGANLLG